MVQDETEAAKLAQLMQSTQIEMQSVAGFSPLRPAEPNPELEEARLARQLAVLRAQTSAMQFLHRVVEKPEVVPDYVLQVVATILATPSY